ncbi:hypothetical protein Tco_0064166 [Tanacetum coccineum]
MFKRRLIIADQASVFMEMTYVHISSGLVLHQMTSDHNRSELGIQDHSNEPSSSKLVPKVVPLANKTATSRQELELLFHLHIAMLRTTGINPMIQPEPEDLPKDNPKLEIAILRKKPSTQLKAETGSIHIYLNHKRIAGIATTSWTPVDAIAQALPVIRVSLNRNLSHLSRRYTSYLLTSHSEIVDIE